MASALSASAPPFIPTLLSTSSDMTELEANVNWRKNEEIGTYENGLLIPRDGAKSLIIWQKRMPEEEPEPIAILEISKDSAPVELAALHEISQPVQQWSAKAQTESDEAPLENYEGINSDMSPTTILYPQQAPATLACAPALISSLCGTSQPTMADCLVYGYNRPIWNPAYHKVISPNIERANRVVEEFKIYFGDGRPQPTLAQLQKICLLSGFGVPQSESSCFTRLRRTHVNVFDLVEAGRANEQGKTLAIPTFNSSHEFFNYCNEEGKVCPKWIGKANPLLQQVLNRFH